MNGEQKVYIATIRTILWDLILWLEQSWPKAYSLRLVFIFRENSEENDEILQFFCIFFSSKLIDENNKKTETISCLVSINQSIFK